MAPGGWLEQRSKARQQRRIEPIGLGELAQGLQKAAGVAGIDLRQRQASIGKAPLQLSVIGAGWLGDHALDGMAGEPGDERAIAVGVIGEVARCSIRLKADIEPIFGTVDAGGLWDWMMHLFRGLGLSCGPSRPVSVQATGKREGRSESKATRSASENDPPWKVELK